MENIASLVDRFGVAITVMIVLFGAFAVLATWFSKQWVWIRENVILPVVGKHIIVMDSLSKSNADTAKGQMELAHGMDNIEKSQKQFQVSMDKMNDLQQQQVFIMQKQEEAIRRIEAKKDTHLRQSLSLPPKPSE